MRKIFVYIISYRDNDLINTIADLYCKADRPSEIRTVVFNQYSLIEDKPLSITIQENIRVINVDSTLSKGVGWARNQVQSYLENEEFCLQIDSHMRFEKSWDNKLLRQIELSRSSLPVISTYPPAFIEERYLRHFITKIVLKGFTKEKVPILDTLLIPDCRVERNVPIRGAFVGGCFIFGLASFVKDVPADPESYLLDEEISMSIRLWTYGYNIFHPNEIILYHNWSRKNRSTHWKDALDYQRQYIKGIQKLKALCDNKGEFDESLLGSIRSIDSFVDFCGVDFINGVINRKALQGWYD